MQYHGVGRHHDQWPHAPTCGCEWDYDGPTIDEVLLPHVRLFPVDLNLIKNVWDALGRQVAGRNYPPTNKNTLIRALTEEYKLPQQLLDYVVQSIGLELIEDSVSGLCSHMNKCKNCSFFKGFPTTEKMKGSCLINSSIVLGLRIIGKGFSAGKKLCAFLGLPFLSKLAFRNQERKLLKATERVAQENINAALSEIKGSNSFTKCGISIDGTWQRRGYSSLNGCCPEGSESWCRYQRAKAAGSPLKEIEQGLPNKIINQIKPTYLKLCNETLLKKCLHALHFKYHQARRRFVEWAQNEIAVVPDFHKRILFTDEPHFWLNGYVNKQNCRIWSEANPQVYVETPLHPEKLTVWCALWAGGILLQKR
ncbi:CCHC-type domain-containing protein [Trichonephila clavipes]|nr:CCHC-type domain-containing protein [Trichonephila clavipes]